MIGILNELEVDAFLHKQVIGRLGCFNKMKVYIVPITYAYDGIYIYGHARPGEKINMMRENPYVCFETDNVENMHNWQSVIAWGTYEELKGKAVKETLQLLMNRTYGLEKTHWFDIGLHDAVTYRIKLTEKTGRFEKKSTL